ncbi:hypothetical protein DPMN_044609 [Dreissena polymorpha]|uniref:Uncharacterized protein n=1 Tax=Dreissena polymorpha TaxID=45954 RepID=A0A9D4D4Y2_DREPO|nr:hypothetical protein DPMN_044609 [Dreissena polymorpha]
MESCKMDRVLLAPLVISKAENISTFTSLAEKANQVSENKCQRIISSLESKQTETLAKMTKEMNELKYVLSQIKVKTGKREAIKEQGRNSPRAKFAKVLLRDNTCSDETPEDVKENTEQKYSTKRARSSVITKKERLMLARTENQQRRYSCQLGNVLFNRQSRDVSRTFKSR